MTGAQSCSVPDLDDLPALLTIAAVAEFCAVHDRTVRRWVAQGRLRAVKAGGLVRVPRDELARFLGQ